jgi:hypothetical protein
LEIFSGQLFGGRALLGEFLADKRVSWHDRRSTPEIFKPRHQRKRPALWYAGRLDGAAWCGSETEDLETPAVVPPPPPVPTPSQINWVTGRRLHALHSIRVPGVVNGWLTPIWQKLWTVASEPRAFHQTSDAAFPHSRQKFLNRPGAMSV